MIPQGFVAALIDQCEEDESTAFVDGLISAAKAKITAGGGAVRSLISASYNGKTFAWNGATEMSPAELLSAAREAKRAFTGSSTRITYATFNGITR